MHQEQVYKAFFQNAAYIFCSKFLKNFIDLFTLILIAQLKTINENRIFPLLTFHGSPAHMTLSKSLVLTQTFPSIDCNLKKRSLRSNSLDRRHDNLQSAFVRLVGSRHR